MSAIDTNTPSSLASPTPNAFNELTSEQFVKIMFTELSNQDPLSPNDSNALLEQLSSLRSIESDLHLSNQLGGLVAQNQLASSAALIGKFVTGLTESNERGGGYVVSVSKTADGPVLNLDDGRRIPFSLVDELIDPSIFEAEPADSAPPESDEGDGSEDGESDGE